MLHLPSLAVLRESVQDASSLMVCLLAHARLVFLHISVEYYGGQSVSSADTSIKIVTAPLQDMNVPEGDVQATKGTGSPSAKKAEAGSNKAGARKAPPKKKQRRRQAA